MDKLLKEQNKVEGVDKMDASQMDSTVGTVLSFLKSQGVNVDAVKGAIPNADELIKSSETDNAKSSGGIMGKLGGLLAGASPAVANNTTESAGDSTKAVDSMPAMLNCLTSAGISPQQIESALPLVAGTLKSKCGVDAYSALGIETPSKDAAASSSSGGGGILGGLRGFLNDVKSETTGKE